MVEYISVGENKTITTADFCNTDEIPLGPLAAFDAIFDTNSNLRTECIISQNQAEAAAKDGGAALSVTGVAEVGQTIEIEGSPSDTQQLKIGFDGSYDALTITGGTASGNLEVVSYIADEQVNNIIDRHYYIDRTSFVIDYREFHDEMDPTENELFVDGDKIREQNNQRFVVGVAVRVNLSGIGKGAVSHDVETSTDPGLGFDGQVSYNQIELTWT